MLNLGLKKGWLAASVLQAVFGCREFAQIINICQESEEVEEGTTIKIKK